MKFHPLVSFHVTNLAFENDLIKLSLNVSSWSSSMISRVAIKILSKSQVITRRRDGREAMAQWIRELVLCARELGSNLAMPNGFFLSSRAEGGKINGIRYDKNLHDVALPECSRWENESIQASVGEHGVCFVSRVLGDFEPLPDSIKKFSAQLYSMPAMRQFDCLLQVKWPFSNSYNS